MHKKRLKEPLPPEVKMIRFAPEDLRPLFVAGKDVEKVVVGWSRKTAANWRSLKKGPRFHIVDGMPFYKFSDLEDYFGANPVETA
jgi:hypothetical protein